MTPASIVLPIEAEGDDLPLRAAALASIDLDLDLTLVGEERHLHEALRDLPHDAERLRIVPDDSNDPLQAALRLVASSESAALTCPGSQRLLDLARTLLPATHSPPTPALAAIHPTLRHRGRHDDPFALLLDIGALPGADADALVRFAHLGAAWARAIARTDTPRVALLSSGLPPSAQPPALRDAHRALADASDLPFLYLGPVLADRVLEGEADVIVCDAFAGNLFVRALHGFAQSAEQLVERARQRFQWRIGMSMLGGGIDRLRSLADWESYGGAPLLGYERVVVTLPDDAGLRAWANAFRLARRAHAHHHAPNDALATNEPGP